MYKIWQISKCFTGFFLSSTISGIVSSDYFILVQTTFHQETLSVIVGLDKNQMRILLHWCHSEISNLIKVQSYDNIL